MVSLEDGAATGLGDAGKGMAAGGMYAVQGGPSWMDGWCMRGSDGWCSIGGQTRCVSVVACVFYTAVTTPFRFLLVVRSSRQKVGDPF